MESKNSKSFLGSFIGHRNLHILSQSPKKRPSSRIDTSLDAAATVLQLTKDASEAAKDVPYVKAIAGVLFQIIKVREEIQANKERCCEIIDLVQRKSTTILQSLDIIYKANGVPGLEQLQSDLEEYARFLQAILRDELEPWKVKARSRWSSYANRGKLSDDLQRLERELDDFMQRFSVKRLVAISLDTRATAVSLAKQKILSLYGAALLHKKLFCKLCQHLRSLLLVANPSSNLSSKLYSSSSEPRIAILGSGGMGKTTISTVILHEPRVMAAYPIRYFVSCEISPTIELLETRIADALFIPQANRESNLASLIINHIRKDAHPVLLCIDNLETVWEIESEQPKVDRFFEVLSELGSKLALIVTMRGIQHPKTSFPWNSVVLSGLEMHDSIFIYEELSNKAADASARELLDRLSGSPLAIKLFATMVKEGDKTEQLLSSYNEHGVKTLEIGGNHKLSSLEQSIRLSVFSPRVDDIARLILGLIALLPDGLTISQPWFEGFESVLPDKTLLQRSLRTLRRAALLEEVGNPSRWQMLPPIRHLWNTRAIHSSQSHAIILPELANIRGLLLHGAKLQPLPPLIGQAIAAYAGWASWHTIDESALLASFLSLQIPTGQQAYIYWRLGIVHQRWYRLNAADSSFTRALERYTEINDHWGQAIAHELMGDLHMRQNQLDAAEVSLTCALELFIQLQRKLGEANTRELIGILYVRQDRLDAAERSFARALELFSKLQNRLGEANTYELIGAIYVRRDQLDAAGASFTHALEYFVEIKDKWGEANVRLAIGNLHMRKNQLEVAETSFSCALENYINVKCQWGISACTALLGHVCMRRQNLEGADAAFARALLLWEEVGDKLSIALTHQAIGDLHLRRDQLGDAEASLNIALDIYTTQITSCIDEAVTHRSIGELHLRRGRFQESEHAFRRALELSIAASSQVGQAETHRCLGSLFMKMGDLDVAESSYSEGLRLFLKIKDYQADSCFMDLGKIWVKQGKIQDSEVLDIEALKQHWGLTEQILP
ncbi:hypothetical protein DL96DRAFT_1684825 [Flagelloscypha sp. PMI_526]|nr:hypothetical protein DL96DRAFT_1684825 [Flagelloscypha sp. PMI_526]